MIALKLIANPRTILKFGDASLVTAVLVSDAVGFGITPLPKEVKFSITGRYPFLLHADKKAALYNDPNLRPSSEITAPFDQTGRAAVLSVSRDNSGDIKIVAEVVGFPDIRDEVVLHVADWASLSGKVLDKDMKPVNGAKITLWKGKEPYQSPANPQSSANGTYAFPRIISYGYTLTAEKDGKKKTDVVEVRNVDVVHDIIFD